MALTQVSTSGIKNATIATADIADNAVTFDKVQDIPEERLVGRVSSGSGIPEHLNQSQVIQFLGISAGANQTTINNNADNRIITGSGTANTLEGESELTYSSPQLKLISTSAAPQIRINSAADDATATRFTLGRATGNNHFVNGAHAGDSAITVGGDLLFGVGTSEKMRLNSDGDLLIGRTTTIDTSEALGIKGPSGDHCTFGITTDGTTNLGIIAFNDNDANFRGQIRYSHNLDAMQFHAAGSERIRVDSDGIKFNGDAASANALDDYEEGTCTPEFQPASGSYGYIYRTGHYTRIGDVVHLTASISINGATNASGEVKIQGLPFSVRGVNSTWSGEGGHGVGRWFYAGPNHYCFLVCDNSDDKIRIHKPDGTFLNHTNMSTGYNQSQFSFTVTYLTDA